jgi:hypothetical protein
MTDIGTLAGEQLKLQGLEKAASHYPAELKRAQLLAEVLIILQPDGITTDDVREGYLTKYERELQIGCAMGKVFADTKKWEAVGWKKSTRPQAHARRLNVYKRRVQE